MNSLVIGLICMALLIIMICYGVHIAISMATVGLLGLSLILNPLKAITMLGTQSFSVTATFDFTVIPMFVMMGMLATSTGVSSACYDTGVKWLGRLRGGLGIATTWACAAFGTLNGSALVTASVFAKAAVPSMREHGYDAHLSYGLVSAAGNIGQFIPPSVLIVLYGALSGDSIGRLLMAGISPGISLCIIFSLILVIISFVRPDLVPVTKDHYSWKERIVSLKNLIPIVIVAFIIIGGIFGGIFSSSEAGAIGCVVFLVYAVICRVPLKQVKEAFVETVKTSGMIFIILVSASIFSKLMVVSGIAPAMVKIVNSMNLSPYLFLIAVVIVYIILGCFLDATSCMSICLPLFYPVATALGIDPIHFAMVSLLAMHCGGITPPVGMCVFCVKAVAPDDIEVMKIFKGAMPFLFGMFALVLIFIFFPTLSTFLPNLMFNS